MGILVIAAAIWACLVPSSYSVLWFLCRAWVPFGVSAAVCVCSVILVIDEFRRIPIPLWVMMLVLLASAGSAGFFHHFRDSGESGPLSYEWLNGYHIYALPLVLVSLASRAHNWKMRHKEEKEMDTPNK